MNKKFIVKCKCGHSVQDHMDDEGKTGGCFACIGDRTKRPCTRFNPVLKGGKSGNA